MGTLLAAGPGPSPYSLAVRDSGGRGSKVQGVVCVLKGPLLGDSSPWGWALSSGLLGEDLGMGVQTPERA